MIGLFEFDKMRTDYIMYLSTCYRSACHEILVTSLNQYTKDVSLQCLQCLVLHSSPSTMEAWKYLHPNPMFAAGSDGGVVVVTKPKEGWVSYEALI